jgi:murein DD-endopeptidase MepM/ murein hydrolase activator NlpD
MFRNLILIVVCTALLGVGWVIGSVFPAPALVTDQVKRDAECALSFANFSPEGINNLRASVSKDEFKKITENAAEIAAQSCVALIVERDEGNYDYQSGFTIGESAAPAETPKPAPAGKTPVSAASAPPTSGSVKNASATLPPLILVATDPAFVDQVRLCPKMDTSNKPAVEGAGVLAGDPRRANVNGVTMLLNPTKGGCLASGFGQRGAKLHKGLDYHSPIGIDVYSAADGTVIEKKYRPDYGNMIVIDHRSGVYTRYAHLSSFDTAIYVGAKVKLGQRLGLMGNTADYPIPVHLHWELLLGDIGNPKGSFGLTPKSPFDFVARKG